MLLKQHLPYTQVSADCINTDTNYALGCLYQEPEKFPTWKNKLKIKWMIWFLNRRLSYCHSTHCFRQTAQLGTPQLPLSYTWWLSTRGGEADGRDTGDKILKSGGNDELRLGKPVGLCGTPEDRQQGSLISSSVYPSEHFTFPLFFVLFFFLLPAVPTLHLTSL